MVLRNLKIFWQTDVQIDRQGNEFALTSSGLKGIVKHLIMKYQRKNNRSRKIMAVVYHIRLWIY